MATERTLSIIKPDGVEKGIIGRIISRFETNGLKPIALRLAHLSKREAEGFYAVHRARPFFNDLVAFMTAAPVVLMVLEGENAVVRNREIMGATDPRKAAEGTIRKDFATDIEKNTVHGSDSVENARIEVSYFFPEVQVHPYEWKKKS
jgi:nucleoside-diphosphate kinase